MVENLLLYPFFTNIVLPFIFVLVLTYALMEKIKLLENKQAHLLIALAISFFFIGVPSLLNVTSLIIPVVAILVIIAFSLMLLFGMLGIEFYAKDKSSPLKTGLAAILLIVGLIVIANMLGLFQKISSLLSPELIQLLAFLIITGVVIAVIVGFKTKKGD